MRINIYFDDDLVEKYRSRSPRILTGIYIEHEDTCYPGSDWVDFGAIVLGWWLHSVTELLKGNDGQDICFMDGPFFLRANIKDDMLCLKSDDDKVVWEVNKTEFAKELMRASNQMAKKLNEYGFKEMSMNLNEGVNTLRQVID